MQITVNLPMAMLAVGVAGGAIMTSGVASAADSSSSSAQTISACVNDRTQVVSLLAPGKTTCKAGQSPLSWNAQGPAGPACAPGLPGWQARTV